MIWRTILLFLAYIPLGAHFLRTGDTVPAIIIALMPLLALFRKKALIYLLQLGLVVGAAAVWLPTTIEIAQLRMATGEPWIRMAAILTGVILFSLLTAFLAKDIQPRNQEWV